MFEISTISGVINLILAAFAIPDPPVAPLPPPLIIAGATLRPGLSAKSIAAQIISRQSKAGRQVGNVFVDGDNVEETMELIRVEEIINALLNESVVNVAIPPGTSVLAVGTGNWGFPVISQGFTTTIASGNGIIR
jgi:hypothetical protein